MAPFLLFAAVYFSAAGHGFLKDDFGWILRSRSESLADFFGLFRINDGFYRPIVSVSFAVNEWLFQTQPWGYGATNVLLALACAASIYSLARALEIPRGASIFAAAIWLLNFQGIRMAVLWNSGRTSLIVTLAATAAATALVRGRLGFAVAFLALALFSKEEAILLPLILLVWLVVLRSNTPTQRIRIGSWIVGSSAITAVYLVARNSAGAMTPWSAPWYYTPTFEIRAVLENVLMYADRIGTTAVAAMILAALALQPRRPFLSKRTRLISLCGASWALGAISPMVLLPVRSDLYAVLPSVGVCLIAATLCADMWAASAARNRSRSLAGALLVLVVLAPVYVQRTVRWSSLADFSRDTLSDLQRLTADLPDGADVVLDDDRSTRNNLASAFGTLIGDAYRFTSNRELNLWIEPALGDAELAGLKEPCEDCVERRLRVVGGRLVSSSR